LPCPAVRPFTKGIDTDAEPGAQKAQWEAFDLPNLEAYAPFDFLINVNGMPPTWSLIDNPRWARVQQFSIARCAPVLYALQHFKMPRICVNNDPRAYARDAEMSTIIPEARPVALLDQRRGKSSVTIMGTKWTRHHHYARAESWGYLGDPLENYRLYLVGVIAHAHVNDGIKKSSWEPWDAILDDSIPIWGKGWTRETRGVLQANEVMDTFSQITACPVVSHTPGFYTGKPYVMLNAGCIPMIYGTGQRGTWDPDEVYLGFDSTRRITTNENMWQCAGLIDRHYEECLEQMRETFKPNFSVLDQCIENFKENEFGGYTRD